MKQKINPVINDDTVKLLLSCMVCSKKITDHFYGRWGLTTGTCSRKCEQVQEDKPKLHGGQLCNIASGVEGR